MMRIVDYTVRGQGQRIDIPAAYASRSVRRAKAYKSNRNKATPPMTAGMLSPLMSLLIHKFFSADSFPLNAWIETHITSRMRSAMTAATAAALLKADEGPAG